MAIVTGDRYLEKLVKFVEAQAGPLIDGSLVLKLNPVGLHYVHSRLDALRELESLLTGAPVDYLRAYVSDLGDHRALEQLRRILRLIPSLKVVSVLPAPARDPTPLSLIPFARLRVLELRGCDLSTSAARGLLELRDTLEKIVCHNSTDALRHVFASRIAEIKGMPQWNRLWFVSVACNGLVLMDESLQLLPAVETLDLSRNKFAKLDNLSKCTRLKHLDLGFNQLRSIAPFMQVSCHIVKLVLRSNALTTLHGIENLKSLEGLDVSYNIISNFTELEVLTGLPLLQSLWLEGNPFCCARWYRAHVFSYFNDPDKMQLDEKEMTTREYWQRQIIIASRQKQPASFGFYSPAKVDTGEGSINRKKKKICRLASIESEREDIHAYSDEESISFDAENGSKEDNDIPEDEAEIVDLMNKVERMKKERSALWLWEFKQWMDENSENIVAISKYSEATFKHGKENDMNNKASNMHIGESSRYAADSQATGDESSTYILESDNFFADTSVQLHTHQYFDQSGLGRKSDVISLPAFQRTDIRQGDHESHTSLSVQAESSLSDTLAARGGQWIKENDSISPINAIDNIVGSYSSSDRPGSPPYYQKDILHRRHNLVEEILQLSAESFSVPSSDSDTSSSEGDFCQFDFSVPEDDRSRKENWYNLSSASLDEDNNHDKRYEISQVRENGICLLNSSAEQTSSSSKLLDHSMQLSTDALSSGAHDGQSVHCADLKADLMENKNSNRKPKRRSIFLPNENHIIGNTEISQKSNELDTCRDDVKDKHQKTILSGEDREVTNKKQTWMSTIPSEFCCSSPGIDDFVENYFNMNIADSSMHETCRQYIHCDCIIEQESSYSEREVVLLLSSEHKLYMLLAGDAFNESDWGSTVSLLGCHMVEDVREILVGLGLQVVRVYIERGAEYQFLTRSIEKSRQLFRTMQVFDSFPSDERCSLRSLEQVQVELFEKYICGGSQVSIFQYSMVHFWCSCNKEESWVSRSLFVVGGHVLVCIEDLTQFSTLTIHASSTYFSLDTCCSITDISEMVIEARESRCVCLSLERVASEFSSESKSAAMDKQSATSGSVIWKLKWFSEENMLKFVDLLKAVHGGTNVSPFVVRCIQ